MIMRVCRILNSSKKILMLNKPRENNGEEASQLKSTLVVFVSLLVSL